MLMWRYEIGFALSTILIILLVLSMFVMTAGEIALLQVKVSNNFIKHDEVFWLAEQGLRNVERLLREEPKQVRLFSPDHRFVIYNDQEWWDLNAANIDIANNEAGKIQFLVEQINTDSCLQLDGYPRPGAVFYRITVRTVLAVAHECSIVQSIYATSTSGAKATNSPNTGLCQEDKKLVRRISAGRQSWREIL